MWTFCSKVRKPWSDKIRKRYFCKPRWLIRSWTSPTNWSSFRYQLSTISWLVRRNICWTRSRSSKIPASTPSLKLSNRRKYIFLRLSKIDSQRLRNCSSVMQSSSSAFVSCGQPRVRNGPIFFHESLTSDDGVAYSQSECNGWICNGRKYKLTLPFTSVRITCVMAWMENAKPAANFSSMIGLHAPSDTWNFWLSTISTVTGRDAGRIPSFDLICGPSIVAVNFLSPADSSLTTLTFFFSVGSVVK